MNVFGYVEEERCYYMKNHLIKIKQDLENSLSSIKVIIDELEPEDRGRQELDLLEITFLYRLHIKHCQCSLSYEDVYHAAKLHWPVNEAELEYIGDLWNKREFGKFGLPSQEYIIFLYHLYLNEYKDALYKLQDKFFKIQNFSNNK